MNRVLTKLLEKLMTTCLSVKILAEMAIAILEYLAKHSDNKLDDQLVAIVQEKLTSD